MDADLRRLVLSCLLLGFRGDEPPRWLEDALAGGLGGVVLFASNTGDLPRLTARLRAAAGRDVVVALDEEGGDVTRLDARRGSASPGAAALGYLDDPEATEAVHRVIGERLAEAGVTTDLAPVADVNVDPRNPVIGVRSFGVDGRLVARHVAAAVRGIQAAGVAACVKHFPGHGATRADSHHEVAVVDRSRAELEAVELVPFAAAVDAGARAVMTGHLLVPALDDEIATTSRPITTDLLRGRLGFRGTVVTDALEMRAISAGAGMVAGFVRALAAGADAVETGALEYPHLLDELPAAVGRALDAGSLTPGRLRDAASRTAALAVAAPAPRAGRPTVDVAARCVEVVGELPRLHDPLVVVARPPGGMAVGDLPWTFSLPGATTVEVHDLAGVERVRRAGHSGSTVVAVVRDPQLHAWQTGLLDLADVVVDVGWPADQRPGTPTVRTRGVAPALLAAAADVLAGHDADRPFPATARSRAPERAGEGKR